MHYETRHQDGKFGGRHPHHGEFREHHGGSRPERDEHHGDQQRGQERGHRGPRHFHGGEDGERGHGPFGGPGGGFRGRAKRGEAKYVLLDALRDGPKHGYEIIKALEERSGGQYAPSPGTVYPTMQYLEDQGLVRADQSAERRVYHLTDAGQAELESHTADLADFWERFAAPAAEAPGRPEFGLLRDALVDLNRTVRRGLQSEANTESVARIRQALEQCQSAVREIIAETGGIKTGDKDR